MTARTAGPVLFLAAAIALAGLALCYAAGLGDDVRAPGTFTVITVMPEDAGRATASAGVLTTPVPAYGERG